jgi:16S rRNA (adenine1518-N6/adenine1519-N6)-dimethyltransferase
MPNHIQAKKHFSQNFLVDIKAQERVARGMKEVCSLKDFPVVEIGPGQGDVTKRAVTWNRKLIAIEIDPEAVDYLTEVIKELNFELIHGDVMKLFEDLAGNNLPQDFTLISSLPYHIGSRILVDLAINCPHINFGVIHQKEVVVKTQANPNLDQKLTFFGAWLNLFWDCKYCFDLPPHCFNPKPNVHSAFLQGISLNSQNLDWLNTIQKRNEAKNILKLIFSNPKKTLVNNLKNLNWSQEKILEFVKVNCKDDLNTRLNWSNYKVILEAIVYATSTNL